MRAASRGRRTRDSRCRTTPPEASVMITSTSVPFGVKTSAASCCRLPSQPALWPTGALRRLAHETRVAGVDQEPQRDARLAARQPQRVGRAPSARGLRERDEQHAEVVRGRVLAVGDRGRVVGVDRRDDGVDRVAPVHDRVRRPELAHAALDGGAATARRAADVVQHRVCGRVRRVEDHLLVRGEEAARDGIRPVARERADEDGELERAGAREDRAGVPGRRGASGREPRRPDRRADARRRAAAARAPSAPRRRRGAAARPSTRPREARTPVRRRVARSAPRRA